VKKDFYFELADKFKASSSQTFLKILKFVIKGEKEARILLALPDNPQEVAKKLGRRESEIARKLKDLHMRGFTILEGISPSGPRYSLMNLGHMISTVMNSLNCGKLSVTKSYFLPKRKIPPSISEFSLLRWLNKIKNSMLGGAIGDVLSGSLEGKSS